VLDLTAPATDAPSAAVAGTPAVIGVVVAGVPLVVAPLNPVPPVGRQRPGSLHVDPVGCRFQTFDPLGPQTISDPLDPPVQIGFGPPFGELGPPARGGRLRRERGPHR
jgi:hypothetical protein